MFLQVQIKPKIFIFYLGILDMLLGLLRLTRLTLLLDLVMAELPGLELDLEYCLH